MTATPTHIRVLPPINLSPCVTTAAFILPPEYHILTSTPRLVSRSTGNASRVGSNIPINGNIPTIEWTNFAILSN